MKLRSLLGLVTTLVVLIGMASTLGCSTTISQVTPVIQSTTETTITPPATQIAVAATSSVTTVTQPAAETPVITTTTTPVTTTTMTTPVTTTTTTTPVITTTTTAESKQLILTNVRSTAAQPYGGVYNVDAVTAKNLQDHAQALFLDARYLVDYDKSHISGAISLPVSSVWIGSIDPVKVLLDKDAVLIAYCAPGCPAGLELAEELYVLGYHNVFVLDGGYLVWQNAGYAMITQ